MTEIARMTRDIHNFVRGNMDWDDALKLISKITESEELIDYLLMELDLYDCAGSLN